MARSTTLDLGDVATDLLDSIHLLFKVLALNEVGHLQEIALNDVIAQQDVNYHIM